MNNKIEKTPTELLIKKLSKTTKVLFGTISGMVATALVHPFDVVKVRMQVREKMVSTAEVMRLIVKCEGYGALYTGLSAGLMRQATYTTTRLTTYHILNEYYKSARGKMVSIAEVMRLIVKCEGYGALYTGLSAGLMRQATYTTTRLTTYHILNEYYKRRYNLPQEVSLSNSDKVVIGVYAGIAGAFAGNPAEVALVRLMVDGPRLCSVCTCERRYRGVLHAFYRIAREDGIRALWRGGTLTLARSVAVSFAQIGTYAEVNEHLRHKKVLEGFPAHFITSLASSFVTTLLSLPIDLVKTRYQVRRDTMTQRDILSDILDRKGVRYFWKGITPYFIRMSIHTVTTLVIFEFLAEYFYREEENKKKKK